MTWKRIIFGSIFALAGIGLLAGLLMTDVEGNKALGIGFVALVCVIFGAAIGAGNG